MDSVGRGPNDIDGIYGDPVMACETVPTRLRPEPTRAGGARPRETGVRATAKTEPSEVEGTADGGDEIEGGEDGRKIVDIKEGRDAAPAPSDDTNTLRLGATTCDGVVKEVVAAPREVTVANVDSRDANGTIEASVDGAASTTTTGDKTAALLGTTAGDGEAARK